jgi:hypothetical protein
MHYLQIIKTLLPPLVMHVGLKKKEAKIKKETKELKVKKETK